jgi:hypothetical protein
VFRLAHALRGMVTERMPCLELGTWSTVAGLVRVGLQYGVRFQGSQSARELATLQLELHSVRYSDVSEISTISPVVLTDVFVSIFAWLWTICVASLEICMDSDTAARNLLGKEDQRTVVGWPTEIYLCSTFDTSDIEAAV